MTLNDWLLHHEHGRFTNDEETDGGHLVNPLLVPSQSIIDWNAVHRRILSHPREVDHSTLRYTIEAAIQQEQDKSSLPLSIVRAILHRSSHTRYVVDCPHLIFQHLLLDPDSNRISTSVLEYLLFEQAWQGDLDEVIWLTFSEWRLQCESCLKRRVSQAQTVQTMESQDSQWQGQQQRQRQQQQHQDCWKKHSWCKTRLKLFLNRFPHKVDIFLLGAITCEQSLDCIQLIFNHYLERIHFHFGTKVDTKERLRQDLLLSAINNNVFVFPFENSLQALAYFHRLDVFQYLGNTFCSKPRRQPFRFSCTKETAVESTTCTFYQLETDILEQDLLHLCVQGANVSLADGRHASPQFHPLQCLQFLLELNPLSLNTFDEYDLLPISHACMGSHPAIVQYLYRQGLSHQVGGPNRRGGMLVVTEDLHRKEGDENSTTTSISTTDSHASSKSHGDQENAIVLLFTGKPLNFTIPRSLLPSCKGRSANIKKLILNNPQLLQRSDVVRYNLLHKILQITDYDDECEKVCQIQESVRILLTINPTALGNTRNDWCQLPIHSTVMNFPPCESYVTYDEISSVLKPQYLGWIMSLGISMGIGGTNGFGGVLIENDEGENVLDVLFSYSVIMDRIRNVEFYISSDGEASDNDFIYDNYGKATFESCNRRWWECIDVLCHSVVKSIPILHHAIRHIRDLDRMETLIVRYPQIAHVRDAQGCLPLHIALTQTSISVRHREDEISLILNSYPDAATFEDKDGQLPLHLSLGSKTTKKSMRAKKREAESIFIANKSAVNVACKKTGMFPFMLAATSLDIDFTYGILRESPDVC